MKSAGRAATVAALLLPLAGAPLAAQSWKADLGVNGGASWYSPLLGSDEITSGNGNVRFRAGWLVGAQAGYWFTPRIGLRANGTYTDRPLKQGNGFFAADQELTHDVNLWSGTGDLLFRFKQPSADFRREALPYIALGLGEKWISPAGSAAFVAANGTSTNNGLTFACGPLGCAAPGNTFATVGVTGTPGVIGVNTGTNAAVAGLSSFFLPKQHVMMGLAGLGADFRMSPHMALRLEAGDRIYKPKVWATSAGTTVAGATTELTNGTTNIGKTVHEVYAQLGLHYLMGLASPPVVAVAPAPAPPPPAAPAPAPAPTTQDVSVCVVDPTAPTGLRTVTAQFNPSTNDTTVMVNGQSMSLASSVGTVPVASSATWYV
ncbi:MAG TPA: outer membrane beta-barrel protein, partial [Longimicrobiales bacterium]